MKNFFKSFAPAFGHIIGNPLNFLLSTIPILIGGVLYYSVGSYAMGEIGGLAENYLSGVIGNGTVNTVLNYIITAILYIAAFFIVNFTFVLVVSIIACPFYDLLSERIEKAEIGENLPGLSTSLGRILKNFFKTVWNEIKKISLIVFLAIIAFSLSWIPFLLPLSIFISALLLSIDFLDYSWSRHSLTLKAVRKDLRKNILPYALSGGLFIFLMSIPIVNLMFFSYGVSFFTVLWSRNNQATLDKLERIL